MLLLLLLECVGPWQERRGLLEHTRAEEAAHIGRLVRTNLGVRESLLDYLPVLGLGVWQVAFVFEGQGNLPRKPTWLVVLQNAGS
jgi:hypothetical protein